MKRAGAGDAERQPYPAPAGRRRRRPRRDRARCSSTGLQLAVRHGPRSATTLYVANTDAVMRFPYRGRRDARSTAPRRQGRRPAGGPINHHWTKNLDRQPPSAPAPLRRRSDRTATWPRTGIDAEGGRALDPRARSGDRAACACSRTGLRNPNGLALAPGDERALDGRERARRARRRPRPRLLDRRSPEGGFYGWPYSYYGQHVDPRVRAAAPGPRGAGARAGLRARLAHRIARARVLSRETCSRRATSAAPSSASTAPGTASRSAATR